MPDGDEGNKEGDGSEMRGLEGEEGDQPLEGHDPKKDGYGSRFPAGHERAETDGLFKAAARSCWSGRKRF